MNKIIRNVKKWIWFLVGKPYLFFNGICEYCKLSRKNKYVYMSDGIGDVVWFCAFYQAFLEQYKPTAIKLVLAEWQATIPVLFGIEQKNLIILSVSKKRKLCFFAQSKMFNKVISGQIDDHDFYVNREIRKTIKETYRKFAELEMVQMERLGIEMDSLYKYGYFNLCDKATASEISFAEEIENRIDSINNQYRIGSQSILLVPFANTRLNMPIHIWEAIAKKLNAQGYTVYTNCKNENDIPIPNTKSLVLDLASVACLSVRFGMVISARCGLADLLFCSGANLSVIHYIVGNDRDNYQYLAANLESFEKMEERCNYKYIRKISDYRYSDQNQCDEQIEEIVNSIIHNMRNGGNL
ncbi:MAG: hypothetical protein MR992_02105 [Lachnospiraceae bacterium]|nr:hypothetical protein [Lachnospiraceae bacterium]MDD7628495.1 hypothetical protein [Lachnospiraceae bacterium]MDY4120021.1 hypothetical protein [Lachnospiraceae bacterium]